jgi:hypothetical protein
VQGARHDAFASAVFAGDQHVRLRRTDARGELDHRLHLRRLGDQDGLARRAQQLVLGLQPLAPAQRFAQVDLGAQDGQQAGVLPGFLHEVARSPAHGFDGDVDAGPGGHHHHRQGLVDGVQPRQEVQPFLAGGGIPCVVEVHQHRVELAAGDGLEDLGGGAGGRRLEPLRFEQQAQGLTHLVQVVRDQDAGLGRRAVHRQDFSRETKKGLPLSGRQPSKAREHHPRTTRGVSIS